MQIRSTINGGLAEVDDELAERLTAGQDWELVTAKPARKKPGPKPKPAPEPEPAPAEEQTPEE